MKKAKEERDCRGWSGSSVFCHKEQGRLKPIQSCLMKCNEPCSGYRNAPQAVKQAAFNDLKAHGHIPAMLPV